MRTGTKVALAALALGTIPAGLWIGNADAEQPKGTSATQSREATRPQTSTERQMDPEADRVLRGMSDYLGKLRAFTVIADHETEVERDNGQKLLFSATSRVAVRRPNRFRSDRMGEVADVSFFYDGNDLTIYGARSGFYATAKAPATIDAAVDFARDRLDIDVPGSDLLYADPYRILMEDAVSGINVGMAQIKDVRVHHLAYQGHDTDWQIWIEDDSTPLPRKYVIVTKDMKSQPEFTVELHDWDVNAKLTDDTFEFKPPPAAKKIEFLSLREQSKREMKK